ncbi:MAG TPA: polysaccharide deacetylase family protein, partial [Candidatus Angelobacter sp.]|nr:polysaccharide deacetylase family protein [Candidatus Angelobacter sp.]
MATPFNRSALRAHGKVFWAGLLRASGMLSLARKWVQRHGSIVLTFHRVLSDSELQQTASLGGMIVRDRTFADFLSYASQHCEFANLAQEPDWNFSGKLKLAITFDDGWADNAQSVYPLASRYHVPFVIFIVPERTGTVVPFWPERAAAALDRIPSKNGNRRVASIKRAIEGLKTLPATERESRISQMVVSSPSIDSSAVDKTMTWDQIAELHAGGVTFGSHTSTHEILTMVPAAQAEREIIESRRSIQQKLGTCCEMFSYPNGDYSEPVRDLVAQAGYKFAFLNQEPGVWTRDCDPFLIPRVNVCEYHLVDAKGNFSP